MSLPGKLVRDRIPEIIRKAGREPILAVATAAGYRAYVRAKLSEELQEYLESEDVTELADLIEVCFAAAAAHGVTPVELAAFVRDKHRARGGFEERLVWLGNL